MLIIHVLERSPNFKPVIQYHWHVVFLCLLLTSNLAKPLNYQCPIFKIEVHKVHIPHAL